MSGSETRKQPRPKAAAKKTKPPQYVNTYWGPVVAQIGSAYVQAKAGLTARMRLPFYRVILNWLEDGTADAPHALCVTTFGDGTARVVGTDPELASAVIVDAATPDDPRPTLVALVRTAVENDASAVHAVLDYLTEYGSPAVQAAAVKATAAMTKPDSLEKT